MSRKEGKLLACALCPLLRVRESRRMMELTVIGIIFLKYQLVLLTFILFSSCSSNITTSAKLGDCVRHKWENGIFRVKKTGHNQIIVEEILLGQKYGKIKVVGHLYGGWYLAPCPKTDRDIIDANKN